jgi:glycerophosphoryl diester phosphodiesterase
MRRGAWWRSGSIITSSVRMSGRPRDASARKTRSSTRLATPELIGHRGARGLYPENTIEGFRAALAAGIAAFEIDVALTRDEIVVLSHDPQLDPDITRGLNGHWLNGPGPLIAGLTYADLAAYDVGRVRPGSATAVRFPDQEVVDGARIPALADVLSLDERVHWTIEIKTFPPQPDWTARPEALAAHVATVADAVGASSRVTVQSFDWRGPRHLRRSRPDLAYAWLTCAATANPLWWDRQPSASIPESVAAEGGGTWSPAYAELTRRDLDAAHRLGLRVVPWTVNDAQDAVRLAEWGVDGLITDRPDVLRAALRPPSSRAR